MLAELTHPFIRWSSPHIVALVLTVLAAENASNAPSGLIFSMKLPLNTTNATPTSATMVPPTTQRENTFSPRTKYTKKVVSNGAIHTISDTFEVRSMDSAVFSVRK